MMEKFPLGNQFKHWTKKRIYSCLPVEQMCGKFGALDLDLICNGR